jgi:hypothetical protein
MLHVVDAVASLMARDVLMLSAHVCGHVVEQVAPIFAADQVPTESTGQHDARP